MALGFFRKFFDAQPECKPYLKLGDYWDVHTVSETGLMLAPKKSGFMFELEGLDGAFLASDRASKIHKEWRSALRLSPGEELQIVFKKRVDFAAWVENQLNQAFLSDNPYGRRILLDRLADQVFQMSQDQPRLLSQKIVACFWTDEAESDKENLEERRQLIRSQLASFGFHVDVLDRKGITREIYNSSLDLESCGLQEPEWPAIKLQPGHLSIHNDRFRSLELTKLPESFSELGMIQALTALPYPIDISIRLKARDTRPVLNRLERKRNLLQAKSDKPSPSIESQIEQIDQVLRSLSDYSEGIFDMKLIAGLRLPERLGSFQRKALGVIQRSASQMNFCEFEDTTLGTFDAYLECIPGFSGKNLQTHTVMSSNAIHFLPFFRPAKGDDRSIASFQTRSASIYSIDPVASRLANYNWLVSGTSGAGKSFFVNSLLSQSSSINPNIFIVDIGGSYNRLTRFLGGRIMSLEPGEGFKLSPFFLPPNDDPVEERMRRQHIFQIFLELVRFDGKLPSIEVRHLLSECLNEILDLDSLPAHPISTIIDRTSDQNTTESRRLCMLLEPWTKETFYGQFLDNDQVVPVNDRILTFDLKGLTEFEDLARVVQLIVCASLWARVRQASNDHFSWIVLDEVAFSLLKTQPQFVDELVSTLRKYYAGAVIVVQDLEKVTSNLAGSSILQNTQSKAILQQRGDPNHYSQALSLSEVDQWAIRSLEREKGSFSDIFLIRDDDKTVIRHVPGELEYWLSTTAPEDQKVLKSINESNFQDFHNKVINFTGAKKGVKP